MTAVSTAVADGAVVDRYADRLLRVHRELSFGRIADAVDGTPAFFESSSHGLITLTVRGSQLPERYLWAIYGFRLAQYLQRGWASREIVYSAALTAETYTDAARSDYHTVVVERETGRIRGYGTLARCKDPEPVPLGEPSRTPFVIEVDYGLNLADRLGPDTLSWRAWEGKRLVRDYEMRRSPAAVTVPWWVYLGWATVVEQLFARGDASAVVGDAKKSGAIFQLGLLGFAVEVLDVPPREPDPNDLFAPLWNQAEQARPFILRDSPRLRPTLLALGEVLAAPDPGSVRRRLEARTAYLGGSRDAD